jgi:DNA polymerase-3 subunit gamma/tau
VVFVLCTTEAHKIPATIASRCQHFSFRSVGFEDLTARMAWICQQEGIEADAEALAVLAQAGEGSVRDSLSALDQAIACCGARLDAAEVRALLGAFSLESLETVTQALVSNDSRRMLEVVDELERNGHNLQHFSRELARYFRNLLVARISGADTRLVAASAAERQKLAEIAFQFSEEDLSRYLQLSLDLFRDLQFSLQPRFHLEIGLVRLVQAGRLLPIEEALAATGGAVPRPAPKTAPAAPPPPRVGPSPFDLDRAKKTAAAPAGDPRERLHSYLHEKGLAHLADAVENARITVSGADLNVIAPKSYALYFNDRAMADAASEVFGRPLRLKIAFDDAGEPASPGGVPPGPGAPPAAGSNEDEVTARALANPEVRRFREVFGGEIRKVRNLKE